VGDHDGPRLPAPSGVEPADVDVEGPRIDVDEDGDAAGLDDGVDGGGEGGGDGDDLVAGPDGPIERRIYTVLSDPSAEARGFLRVIDESDEDYLYPADWFVPVELPPKAKKALQLAAART
jgi:hypothetical protein